MAQTTEAAGSVWRIGDVVLPVTVVTAPDPWPERKAGEAFWYVAHCMAGCERRLADDLQASGFGAFVPVRRWFCRRPGGRVVRMERPLFPRYVFVELVPHPRCWAAVRAARDIVGILTNQDAPVRVPDEAIGDLYVARDMKLFDETELPGGIEVLRGDRVSVVGGSWQGYEAVVESRVRRSATLRIVGQKGCARAKVPVDLLRILA